MFARLLALQERHQELEVSIADEAGRPLPDQIKLQGMKRAKLRLKDEIQAVRNARLRRRKRRRLVAA